MSAYVGRRLVAAGMFSTALLVGVGCSSDSTSTATTSTPSAVSSTSVPPSASTTTSTAVVRTTTTAPATTTTSPTTTAASSTTSTAAPTTTSAPPATTIAPNTTTTLPAGRALVLRDNGLGNAAFGADPDGVIDFVAGYLGPPTVDSGWMDPLSLGSCPGTEVRTVSWGDLDLYFGDESQVVVGRRHFFAYSYGPAFAATINPAGPATDAGIGIGSTVAQLKAADPGVVIHPAEATAPASFEISPALTGQLSGIDDSAAVTAVSGGFGCGE
ncbi:MAG: hypothetical protein JWM12_1417 [Ilumatobacteraceae bacterium]|nr:hypothetical protein [Ilumatobacteraceae bacterium]